MAERDPGFSSPDHGRIRFPLREMRTDAALGAGALLFLTDAVGLLAEKTGGIPPSTTAQNIMGDFAMAGLGAGVGILVGMDVGRSYSDYLIKGNGNFGIPELVRAERSARDRMRGEQARAIFIEGGFDSTRHNERQKLFFEELQTRLSNHNLRSYDIRRGRRILRRQGVIFGSPRRTLLKRAKRG